MINSEELNAFRKATGKKSKEKLGVTVALRYNGGDDASSSLIGDDDDDENATKPVPNLPSVVRKIGNLNYTVYMYSDAKVSGHATDGCAVSDWELKCREQKETIAKLEATIVDLQQRRSVPVEVLTVR